MERSEKNVLLLPRASSIIIIILSVRIMYEYSTYLIHYYHHHQRIIIAPAFRYLSYSLDDVAIMICELIIPVI